MLLTAVEPRRKGLTALFIDGEFAMNVDTETLLKAKWKPGREFDDEELQLLLQQSNARRASEKALYLLEHSSRSKKELTDRIARDTGREAAQAAADHMEELGLVDDEDYARRLTADLTGRKGYSARRACQELARRGIDRDMAEEITEELAPPPEERLRELIERKYARYLSDEKGRRRTIAALQRLGWGWDDIKHALAQFGESFDEA